MNSSVPEEVSSPQHHTHPPTLCWSKLALSLFLCLLFMTWVMMLSVCCANMCQTAVEAPVDDWSVMWKEALVRCNQFNSMVWVKSSVLISLGYSIFWAAPLHGCMARLLYTSSLRWASLASYGGEAMGLGLQKVPISPVVWIINELSGFLDPLSCLIQCPGLCFCVCVRKQC